MNKIRRTCSKTSPPMLLLWFAFFLYAALVAAIVQLVMLPKVFPSWHAGDGLLVANDSIWFHALAENLSQRIQVEGWSVWELRPMSWATAGIAAAVYAVTVPKPWVIIPINAALYATAGLALLWIMRNFVPAWRQALWCVLPFLLYPSAALWYTQLLKDGYSIAGAFTFLVGWILLSRASTWEGGFWPPFRAVALAMFGALLAWIVRPYVVQMMQGMAILLAILLTCAFVIQRKRARITLPRTLLACVVVWMVVFMVTPLTKGGISEEAPISSESASESASELANGGLTWQYTNWLPSFVEDRFFSLALVREGFTKGFPHARSNIDVNVSFHNARDVLAYVPRAVEIGLLAPFPNQWLGKGYVEATTAMRRVSAGEMIGIYIALLFLPYAIWSWRRQIETWIVAIFCFGMMIIYALVTANIGTLYRTRYGFLMLLVALGVAGLSKAIEAIRQRGRGPKAPSLVEGSEKTFTTSSGE
jgi:hypothetical protein